MNEALLIFLGWLAQVPVDEQDEEFELIDTYLQNTHAPTHSQYSLQLVDLFKVEREGEGDKFKKWKDLHNRMVMIAMYICI